MNGHVPVEIGQELDIKIEAVGEKGDGVAKVKGFVLFVPGTKEGDNVRVKVTKVLRNMGFAEVVGDASPADTESGSEETSEESQDLGDESAEESQDSEDFGEETSEAAEETAEEEKSEEATEEPSEEEKPKESEEATEEPQDSEEKKEE